MWYHIDRDREYEITENGKLFERKGRKAIGSWQSHDSQLPKLHARIKLDGERFIQLPSVRVLR